LGPQVGEVSNGYRWDGVRWVPVAPAAPAVGEVVNGYRWDGRQWVPLGQPAPAQPAATQPVTAQPVPAQAGPAQVGPDQAGPAAPVLPRPAPGAQPTAAQSAPTARILPPPEPPGQPAAAADTPERPEPLPGTPSTEAPATPSPATQAPASAMPTPVWALPSPQPAPQPPASPVVPQPAPQQPAPQQPVPQGPLTALSELRRLSDAWQFEWGQKGDVVTMHRVIAEQKAFMMTSRLEYHARVRVDDAHRELRFTEYLKESGAGVTGGGDDDSMSTGFGVQRSSYNTRSDGIAEAIEEQVQRYRPKYPINFRYDLVREQAKGLADAVGYAFRYGPF
ncbi:MAG: hypothetical protein LCH87_02160, partial [Actinobacteria bacterium]|nr:hypothetical protein [Actinomycetota bacterium]